MLEFLELSDRRDKSPGTFSTGLKQKLSLARALVHDPPVVFLDEPTSNLDPIMSRRIDKLIHSLKNKLKITSIVVTHDLVSAFGIADRIAMIYKGSIIECASPEDFKNSKVEYVREFIKSQIH